MKLPHGYTSITTTQQNKVCHLKDSIYGIRQALRCWFEKLFSTRIENRFFQCKANYSLSISSTKEPNTYILMHVDDIIVIGNDAYHIRIAKEILQNSFKIKDLGKLPIFWSLKCLGELNEFFRAKEVYQRSFKRLSNIRGKIG